MTVHNTSLPTCVRNLLVINIQVQFVDQVIVLQPERVVQIQEMPEEFGFAHSIRSAGKTYGTDVVILSSAGHYHGLVKQPRVLRFFNIGI